MRLALLGDHIEALRIGRALGSTEHQLVTAAGLSDAASTTLLADFPGLRLASDWEELVPSEACDAVIVGGASESVLNAVRQLASNGKPLIFVPQAAQGSAFIYELSLIHDDNNVALLPAVPLVTLALVQRLRALIASEQIGRIVLMRLERGLTASSTAGQLSKEQIHAELLHDVLLLRFMAGPYSRITAVFSGTSEAGATMATVTLGGEGLPEATWIARVAEPTWSLIVTGTDGEAALTLDRASLAGTLTIKPKNSASESFDDLGASAGALALQSALAQRPHSATAWLEMTRGFETVEATATSLRRRRTIDLHFETTSERSIFKSQMAAGGCSLLLLTLVGLVAFLLLGAFLDSRSMVQRSAEATGRIIRTNEFNPRSAELNLLGQQHISELARRLERSPEPLFVMPEESGATTPLDQQRREAVITELGKHGQRQVAALVDHAQLPSHGVQLLLRILRAAWIAPLMIFLALQALLFVARPASQDDPLA